MTISTPTLTVVIPTANRQRSGQGAVESALGQSLADLEVIVVDDASEPPLHLHPRRSLRILRLDRRSGPAAARNAGLAVARGSWITFLDDDDRLLPQMAAASLDAIDTTRLSRPVVAISGMAVVDEGDRVIERRLPPTFARGNHFLLERAPAGCSYLTKQTLVVDRELLQAIAGFDEGLAFREWSDLFLRLNPVCSIVGVPSVGYRHFRGPGARLSRQDALVEEGTRQLLDKHRRLFEEHPEAYVDELLGHARLALATGRRRAALRSTARALRLRPGKVFSNVLHPIRSARTLFRFDYPG